MGAEPPKDDQGNIIGLSCADVIQKGIEAGYRHIDCAWCVTVLPDVVALKFVDWRQGIRE